MRNTSEYERKVAEMNNVLRNQRHLLTRVIATVLVIKIDWQKAGAVSKVDAADYIIESLTKLEVDYQPIKICAACGCIIDKEGCGCNPEGA